MAATEHFMAIILDVMLPGRDGWETLYRLKSDPATSHVPVIIATSFDEKGLGLFLGANDCLVKPVGNNRLLQAIENASGDFKKRIRNVAVIDDDPSLLRLVQRILKKVNFEVWTYENGRDFLESLSSRRPDAVILDLLMPHLDGFQVIESLRKSPENSDIPVIVMTAKVLTEDDRFRLNDGVLAVIQKDDSASEETFRRLVDQLHLVENRKEHRQLDPVF